MSIHTEISLARSQWFLIMGAALLAGGLAIIGISVAFFSSSTPLIASTNVINLGPVIATIINNSSYMLVAGFVLAVIGLYLMFHSNSMLTALDKIQTSDLNQFDKGIFLINLLGVVYDPTKKKVLIGRRENDPYIKNLSWVFPGGRPTYKEELEQCLKNTIRAKTGLNVKIVKLIFAKTYPEKRTFLSLYYQCEVLDGKEQGTEDFRELKWVKPTEVKDYFTTSLHPVLFEFLKTLE